MSTVQEAMQDDAQRDAEACHRLLQNPDGKWLIDKIIKDVIATEEGYAGIEDTAGEPAEGPADRLPPELRELSPTEPVGGPVRLGIGGEGNAAAETELPLGEDRFVLVGYEWDSRQVLGCSGDIAE